ncbi:tetraspanin-15-like isoform X2 [Eupeodes corollae]|nr:tetraspanin-15-like isoform X2 [Eupeodes corollae]
MFSPMLTESGRFLKSIVYLVLFACFIILLSTWFACYSILKRSSYSLVTFLLTLVIVVGIKVIVGTWISYNKDRISDFLIASVRYSIQQEYGQISTTTVTFDLIQKNFKCCGADGPIDWMSSQYNNVGQEDLANIAFSSLNLFYSIPESCCRHEISDVACEIARKRKVDASLHAGINNQGCVRKLTEIVLHNSGLLYTTFIVVIFVDISVIGLTLYLCCNIFQKKK